MSKFLELEVKPEASGSIVAIPVSSTGSDGKATSWGVRDEKGSTLVKADAVTSQVTLAPLAGTFRLPVYADDTARDAAVTSPTGGEMVYNQTSGTVEFYDGTTWIGLPKS